jgi:hypothetical protein
MTDKNETKDSFHKLFWWILYDVFRNYGSPIDLFQLASSIPNFIRKGYCNVTMTSIIS